MSQCVLTLAVAWSMLSPRPAAPAPGAPTALPQKAHVPSNGVAEARPTRVGSGPAPFVITRETEVRLDGRLCQYEEVPEGAVITAAEVGPDRRTFLRVHFRSAK
jgi:hypothetical protein